MSYQQDRENATKLIDYAAREDFSKEWGDYFRRRALLKQYDFSNRFEAALLREDLLTWEDLIEAISRVTKRLYPRDETRDSLGEFRYRLLQRRFSNDFIDVFERLAYRQIGRKSDLMVFHFSQDMPLRDLVYLEDSINKYYHEAILALDNVDAELRKLARETRLIRVRSFTHPGSVEIFIAAIVVTPLLTSLGALLITKSMTSRQIRRREQVKIIAARLRESSLDVANPQLFDEEPTDEESQTLEEVQNEDEFAEIQVPLSDAVPEIVGNMTSKPGSFGVGKGGNRIAGIENSE